MKISVKNDTEINVNNDINISPNNDRISRRIFYEINEVALLTSRSSSERNLFRWLFCRAITPLFLYEKN